MTALANQDGHRRATSRVRRGATVITKVMTKKTGATMLAADCKPAQITMMPATIKTAKNGGPGRWPATGIGSGSAWTSTVFPATAISFASLVSGTPTGSGSG